MTETHAPKPDNTALDLTVLAPDPEAPAAADRPPVTIAVPLQTTGEPPSDQPQALQPPQPMMTGPSAPPPSSGQSEPRPGHVIPMAGEPGRWLVLKKHLGHGGEGQVWSACEENGDGPMRAVKIHFDGVGREIAEPLDERMEAIRRVRMTVGDAEGLVFFEPPYRADAPIAPDERAARQTDVLLGRSTPPKQVWYLLMHFANGASLEQEYLDDTAVLHWTKRHSGARDLRWLAMLLKRLASPASGEQETGHASWRAGHFLAHGQVLARPF